MADPVDPVVSASSTSDAVTRDRIIVQPESLHGETAPRRGVMAFRIGLFLMFVPAGALLWRIVLGPVWEAARAGWASGQNYGVGGAMARALVANAPGVLLTLAALFGVWALCRRARVASRNGRGQGGLVWMGLLIALAGMAQLMSPSLSGAGLLSVRFTPDAGALALLAVGGIVVLLARAVRGDVRRAAIGAED